MCEGMGHRHDSLLLLPLCLQTMLASLIIKGQFVFISSWFYENCVGKEYCTPV